MSLKKSSFKKTVACVGTTSRTGAYPPVEGGGQWMRKFHINLATTFTFFQSHHDRGITTNLERPKVFKLRYALCPLRFSNPLGQKRIGIILPMVEI
jgi:hypothetical protein